jgi:hypothetical protein
MPTIIRNFFVCDKCRSFCDGYRQCRDEKDQEYPRKLHIECLGPLCDDPCSLQRESPEGLSYEMLLDSMAFLASRLDQLLISKDEKTA